MAYRRAAFGTQKARWRFGSVLALRPELKVSMDVNSTIGMTYPEVRALTEEESAKRTQDERDDEMLLIDDYEERLELALTLVLGETVARQKDDCMCSGACVCLAGEWGYGTVTSLDPLLVSGQLFDGDGYPWDEVRKLEPEELAASAPLGAMLVAGAKIASGQSREAEVVAEAALVAERAAETAEQLRALAPPAEEVEAAAAALEETAIS